MKSGTTKSKAFWVHVMHVLDMLRLVGVRNIVTGHVMCPLEHSYNMEGYECKVYLGITEFFKENMNGANGKLGENIVMVAGWVL